MNNTPMKMSFLAYYKMIIKKVSFDINLVHKEYAKAKNVLPQHEIKELGQWMVRAGFSTTRLNS